MKGRPCEAAGSPQDRGASGGGRLQLEKSGGVRPSRGTTYPGIPATVVLGVVMPPEEAVTPYPGVCSTIWLHDSGGSQLVGSHALALGARVAAVAAKAHSGGRF